MNNTEDILKRILLNMKYDSRKTLSENYEISLLEDDNKRDTKEYWDNLYRKGKIDKKTYDYHIERIEDLEFNKSVNKGVKTINSEPEGIYQSQSFVTYKTVVPGKTLTVPDTKFVKLFGTENKSNFLEPLVWHDKNKPYNDVSAKQLFEKACTRTSIEGDNTYFIDNQGNQCKHLDKNGNYIIKGDYTYELKSYSVGSPAQIKIKNGTSASFDKTTKLINIPVFYTAKNAYLNDIEEQEIATFNCGDFITINNVKYGINDIEKQTKGGDFLTSAFKKYFCLNDKVIDFSSTIAKQGTYDSNCKALDKNLCLQWSWTSLQVYGGVDKGLERFKLYESYEKAKLDDGVTYQACAGIPKDSKQKYPWFTQYTGFYDESKFKPTDQTTIWGCPANAITTLPTIPTFSYGNDEYNISISDQDKKEQYLKNLKSKEYQYDAPWLIGKDEYFKETDDMVKNKTLSAVGGGIRIKGK